MPASPPLMPTIILSSTTSGAAVIEWPVGFSPTWTDPALDARARVERDEVAVERADVHHVVEDGHAAVHAREAEVQHARRNRPRPFPHRLAALQIQRGDRGRAGRDVHHAVDDDRRRSRPSRCPAADTPRPAAAARRCRRDLLQRREAVRAVRARVHRPLALLGQQWDDASANNTATRNAPPPRQRRSASLAVARPKAGRARAVWARERAFSFRTSQRRQVGDQIVELAPETDATRKTASASRRAPARRARAPTFCSACTFPPRRGSGSRTRPR